MSGYFLVARKVFDSFKNKPPLQVALFLWMLSKAQYKDNGNLKRGQLFTTIADMQEAMSYKIGYRKIKPSVKEIRRCYDALTKGTTIGTTKGTRGMVITINKYNEYQDPKFYEGHNEGHNERESRGTLKKNEVKEGMNKDVKTIVEYLNEKSGKDYRYQTRNTQSHINARLSEGYTLDDFRAVIDFKVREWSGTEWEKFIRPDTLFGAKFEGYLQASKAVVHTKPNATTKATSGALDWLREKGEADEALCGTHGNPVPCLPDGSDQGID